MNKDEQSDQETNEFMEMGLWCQDFESPNVLGLVKGGQNSSLKRMAVLDEPPHDSFLDSLNVVDEKSSEG